MKTTLIALCILLACSPAFGAVASDPGGALDQWTKAPLAKVTPVNWSQLHPQSQPAPVQVKVHVGYPVHGSHWTHPGNTREGLINHLLTDGIHRGSFSRSQLEAMSYQQLESLHDDQHEGRVKWQYLSSAPRVAPQVRTHTYVRGLFGIPFSSSDGCPGGVCPR